MAESVNQSKYDVELIPKTIRPINLCWSRLDNKSKKLAFMITHSMSNLDSKASPDTIENISEQIESLQLKLDRISQNIAAQGDVEMGHFLCKSIRELTDCSDTNGYEITDLDLHSENGLRRDYVCGIGLLHYVVLQSWESPPWWG